MVESSAECHLSGSHNDATVLSMDRMFHSIMNGDWGRLPYQIGSEQSNLLYFLVDGIYPPWATFVRPLRAPSTPVESKFSKSQESVRKDVERLFGVVKARFKIIRSGNRIEFREKQTLVDVILVSCRMKSVKTCESLSESSLHHRSASFYII